MKKFAALLCTIFLLTLSVNTAFAGGRGYYSPYRPSYGPPRYPVHHHRVHHDNSANLIAGLVLTTVIGGLLLSSVTAPPRTVYRTSSPAPQPPPVCVINRRVGGEWQRSPYDGSSVWVTYPYPMVKRIQVPCN